MRMLVRAAVAAVCLWAGAAQAATLVVDDNGILLGANGVDVQGTLYNVRFKDGTCAQVFTGCADSSAFLFAEDFFKATDAGQALLDQVLLGKFDTMPQLTRGCGDPAECMIITPFLLTDRDKEGGANTYNVNFIAAPPFEDDGVGWTISVPNIDLADVPNATWAVWAPVPEPGTWLLLAAGLACVGGHRKLHGRVRAQ